MDSKPADQQAEKITKVPGSPAAGIPDHGMSAAQREAWEAKRQEQKFRRLRRKAREAEGEIEDLNITPMLDMMTIILVFLLKSYNTGISPTMSADLLPPSSTTMLDPVEAATVTITKSEISVGDKTAVLLNNWTVPAAALNPKQQLFITPVQELLKKEVDNQKKIAKNNKQQQFEGLLSVIGDRDVPYKLLFSVLATAGQDELSNYKFVVLKQGQ